MQVNSNVVRLTQRQRLAQDPELYSRIMEYDHKGLRERMEVKYGWEREFTDQLFFEMKRFLYLCATRDESLAPPEEIDEIWHNFILFTRDYANFCMETVGIFLHHQPLSEKQKSSSDGTLIQVTLDAAKETFGDTLSEYWSFHKIPGSCGPGTCGASTNCQD